MFRSAIPDRQHPAFQIVADIEPEGRGQISHRHGPEGQEGCIDEVEPNAARGNPHFLPQVGADTKALVLDTFSPVRHVSVLYTSIKYAAYRASAIGNVHVQRQLAF